MSVRLWKVPVVSRLRVASWPGYGATHNAFVPLFLDGLAAADCEIISCETVEACATARADVLTLHWAERVFGEARSSLQALGKIRRLLTLLARRPAGMRVVWLVHNLAPHDARPAQRLIWPPYTAALARQVDGFMTLSPATVATVRVAMPALADKPGLGLWHPAYPEAELTPAERHAARSALGWTANAHVLGYCGQIRPYKGVEDLLEVFCRCPDPRLRLLLAGRPGNAAFEQKLRTAAAADPRIVLQLQNLTGPDFRSALGVCDTVVAPLRSYLHSGSILHALSAGRPVLTPDTPFAHSLADLLGPAHVQLYDGPLTPDLLTAAARVPPPGLAAGLEVFAPNRVGAEAAAFLRSLVNRGSPAIPARPPLA